MMVISDGPPERPDPVDPDLIDRPDVRALLAAHDIGTFYRVLGENGWSQRRIARATGTQQPEIWEIVKGRRVIGYDVLVRIAEGLGIPRERMGLSFGAYADEVTTVEPLKGVDEDVLRRHFEHLLALSAVAAFGSEVPRIGELATGLAAPGVPGDLPSRIGPVDVAAIRRHTEHLRSLSRTYGGQASTAVALAEWADQWLTVDASDAARYALLGRLVFSGQLINCYIMLRTAGSGTRRRPLAGSGIRVPSEDVEYYSGIRCTGQHPFGRVRGWGRRCG